MQIEGLEALMAVIFDHEVAGRRVPCVDPRIGHRWLSDDPAEQQAAVFACASCCPALTECSAYVTSHDEVAGVWAGRLPVRHRVGR